MHNSLWFIKRNGKENLNSWPLSQQCTDSGPTPYKLWTAICEGSSGNQWCWLMVNIAHIFTGTQLSQKSDRKQREKGVPSQRYLESVEMVDVTRTIPYSTPPRCSFPYLPPVDILEATSTLCSDSSGFKSCLCYLWALSPWASYVTFLFSFWFLIIF